MPKPFRYQRTALLPNFLRLAYTITDIAFSYTLKTDAYDHSAWNDVTVSKAVRTVPGTLAEPPIFLSIDDTISKNPLSFCPGGLPTL